MREQRPVVASYVPVFCQPEMWHLYRQVSGLVHWRAHVITQRWQHRKTFHMHKRWVTVLPKYRWRFFRRLWFTQLRRIPWQVSHAELIAMLDGIQTHHARVVHLYFGHIAPHWLPLLQVSPWPVVVSFHGADAGVGMDHPVRRRLMASVFQHAAAILARSQALLDDLAALGCPPEKLALNRTGIPLEEFPFLERPRQPDQPAVLLQSGRLIAKKGYATTLRALAALRAQGKNLRLHIAGEGPLEPELRRLAAELGIAEAIHWLGFLRQDNLHHQLHTATLFAHPSETSADGNREGVPNGMLEAMATGLPVVATRHGGIPEAITHDQNGLLIDEGDHTALAAAIASLLDHPAQAAAIGRAAADSVRRHFSREASIASLEAIYDKIAPPVPPVPPVPSGSG